MDKNVISKLREVDTFVSAVYSLFSDDVDEQDKSAKSYIDSYLSDNHPDIVNKGTEEFYETLLDKEFICGELSGLGLEMYLSTDKYCPYVYLNCSPLLGMHYIICMPITENSNYVKVVG